MFWNASSETELIPVLRLNTKTHLIASLCCFLSSENGCGQPRKLFQKIYLQMVLAVDKEQLTFSTTNNSAQMDSQEMEIDIL